MRMFQEILVYIFVAIAFAFLVRKFFFKSGGNNDSGCGPDCNC